MDAAPPLDGRPRWPEELDDVRADLDARFRATPLYALLGIELRDWGPGWAQLRMGPGAAVGNLAGSVHGGATFSLADAAFEVACNAYGRLSVALETTVHYSSPGRLGEVLVGDGWEVARGRRTATYRLEVRSEDEGRLVATYLALAYRTERWHLPEERFPEAWRAAS